VRITELQLYPFEKAQPRLLRLLDSDNPIHRYWGLINCTVHGRADEELTAKAEELAETDHDLLVRTRAAEYLSWAGVSDPRAVIMDVLSKTVSGEEAGLILNTVVLLKDGKTRVDFEIAEEDLNPAVRNATYVKRRMEYLNP